MTPHLQVETQNGKTRIKYLELPEEPLSCDQKNEICKKTNGNCVNGCGLRDHDMISFKKAKAEALSKGIEVHPDSMDFALGVIVGTNIFKSDFKFEKNGDLITGVPDGLYPVSVRVKEFEYQCKFNGQWGKVGRSFYASEAVYPHSRKEDRRVYALLEEIKDEHDSPILNEILSEITPEEQAKTDKEMTEKMEAPDAEDEIGNLERSKFHLSVAEENDLGGSIKYRSENYVPLILATETCKRVKRKVLSSLRREVETERNYLSDSRGIEAMDRVLTLIDKHLKP